MSDPERTASQAQPGAPQPAGGDRRPLRRAPGERYGGGSGGAGSGRRDPGSAHGPAHTPSRTRALVAAVLVADAGAALFFLLGLLDLGVGLVAVAAFAGWATALALVWRGREALPVARTRIAIAAFLGGWSVIGGIIVDWVYALVQGGVLGPLDYVAQRYGVVALLALAAAAGSAALRAR